MQSDFPLTDEDVINVAEGLVYDGGRLDPMRVKQWLRQFGSRERVIVAYTLLKAMRERWYFDATAMSILLDDAFKRAVARLSLGGQLGIGDAELAPVRERICVGYFGPALKSGAEYCRTVKKKNRLVKSGDAAEALAWLARQDRRSMVLFLDDVVGTGNQASFFARKVLREAVEGVIGSERIALFVPVFAYQEGVEQFQDIAAPIEIDPVKLLDDSDRAFSSEAKIFADDAERMRAKEMCEEIGAELWPEHPLGYEGMQSLLVLHTAIPNATLPIFWKEGMVRGLRWQPLFPHR
ncbi:MAG: hypothetical protein JNK64_18740 [Myxococcales bacterium]|nr:hypothetical protein [Myxococcales bacterium]